MEKQSTALATPANIAGLVGADIERVLIGGDLSKLAPDQRISYYKAVCDSMGLNWLTQPFGYIVLNGKLVLYAKKECAEQIRSNRGVSIDKPEIKFEEGLCLVIVTGHDKTGRTDTDMGAVYIDNLKGADRANAIKKAITQAKRRVTLSMCGLGFPTEDEIDDRRDVRHVTVDENGEIIPPAKRTEWTEELDQDGFAGSEPETEEGQAYDYDSRIAHLGEIRKQLMALKVKLQPMDPDTLKAKTPDELDNIIVDFEVMLQDAKGKQN